jgi:serine/threonine protein kinase
MINTILLHLTYLESNILIDEGCHAQLADFGLSMIVDTNPGPATTTTSHAGNVYWTSPERLAGSRQRRSVTDDVYAFGCLCYAVRVSRVDLRSD